VLGLATISISNSSSQRKTGQKVSNYVTVGFNIPPEITAYFGENLPGQLTDWCKTPVFVNQSLDCWYQQIKLQPSYNTKI